jgi:hypothetical protein
MVVQPVNELVEQIHQLRVLALAACLLELETSSEPIEFLAKGWRRRCGLMVASLQRSSHTACAYQPAATSKGGMPHHPMLDGGPGRQTCRHTRRRQALPPPSPAAGTTCRLVGLPPWTKWSFLTIIWGGGLF